MTQYDEYNLTDSDVDYLMNSLKYPKDKLNFNDIKEAIASSITLLGSGIDQTDKVIGIVDGIEYLIHIYCGDPLLPQDSLSYSIHLRFKSSNLHLARLDINGRHKNPDEHSAHRYSHIHIYSSAYSNKSRVAIPIDINEFPNIRNIAKTFDDFCAKLNVRNKTSGKESS